MARSATPTPTAKPAPKPTEKAPAPRRRAAKAAPPPPPAPPPTVKEIVERFGGPRKLADLMSFPHVSRVSNWFRNGIPTPCYVKLLDVAAREGIAVTLDELARATADPK